MRESAPSDAAGSAVVAFVVARAENGVIGIDGALPWRLPGDLRHFRQLTMGKPVIMGRKTHLSIGKPLEGRDNIVVSRDKFFEAEGVYVKGSVKAALSLAAQLAAKRQTGEIMVIGGAQIYAATLPYVRRIYLTEVHAKLPGNVIIPDFSDHEWVERDRRSHCAGEKDSHDYSFVVLERASK